MRSVWGMEPAQTRVARIYTRKEEDMLDQNMLRSSQQTMFSTLLKAGQKDEKEKYHGRGVWY